VRASNDLVLVAEMAGHRRLETTRRYSLPSAADRQAAMEALELLLTEMGLDAQLEPAVGIRPRPDDTIRARPTRQGGRRRHALDISKRSRSARRPGGDRRHLAGKGLSHSRSATALQ
jgi:hypothetical protein